MIYLKNLSLNLKTNKIFLKITFFSQNFQKKYFFYIYEKSIISFNEN